jgi:hypothetical protein
VITDSPLYLSIIYAGRKEFGEWFTEAVMTVNSKYKNTYWIIDRDKEYQSYGRNQTENEARVLDNEITKLTNTVSCGNYMHVRGDEMAAMTIYNEMFGELRSVA